MKILKSSLILLISSLFLISFSCNKEKNENLLPETLTGKWVEEEPADIIQFGGTNHIIEFKTDSFFLARQYWTDALDPENSCVNGHTDYYKGKYEIIDNQISFVGKATNEQFVLTTPPCERPTTYEESFQFEEENEQVLILNPEQEVYFQIRLLKEE